MKRVQITWAQRLRRPESLTILSLLALFVSVYAFMGFRKSQSGQVLNRFGLSTPDGAGNRGGRALLDPSDQSSRAAPGAVSEAEKITDYDDSSSQHKEVLSDEVANGSIETLRASEQDASGSVAAASANVNTLAASPSNPANSDRAAVAAADKSKQTVLSVWAEFQPGALSSLGASQPGLYPVPKLTERMREMKGSYRVLESGTHSVGSDSNSIWTEAPGRSRVGIEVGRTKPQDADSLELLISATMYSGSNQGRELTPVQARLDDAGGLILVLPTNVPAQPNSAEPPPPILALILTKKQPSVAGEP